MEDEEIGGAREGNAGRRWGVECMGMTEGKVGVGACVCVCVGGEGSS